MTPQPLSSTAKAGEVANNASPGADDFTFRAPRWSDLTACLLCARTPDDPWLYRCEMCGDEGRVFTEQMQ